MDGDSTPGEQHFDVEVDHYFSIVTDGTQYSAMPSSPGSIPTSCSAVIRRGGTRARDNVTERARGELLTEQLRELNRARHRRSYEKIFSASDGEQMMRRSPAPGHAMA